MKTIMIVDKDQDKVSTIETLLKKNNYKTIVSFSSGECLKKLKECRPDLILINSFMSRENILPKVNKMKAIKIAYLVTDEYELDNLKLYSNVVGFVNETGGIDKFLQKIKELA